MSKFRFDPTGGLGGDDQSFLDELRKAKETLRQEEESLSEEDKIILEANKEATEFLVEELGMERVYGFALSNILTEIMKSQIVLLESMVVGDERASNESRVEAIHIISGLRTHVDMIGQISLALWGHNLMEELEKATEKFYNKHASGNEPEGS